MSVSEDEVLLVRGKYQVRSAQGRADVAAAQNLRTLCFGTSRTDQDAFDDLCSHLLVEEIFSQRLVACCRLLKLSGAREIDQSYSGQFYDVSALRQFQGPVAELGRFCIRPGVLDPDILRIAWGGLTAFVDQWGIRLLFGCSSFSGTDAKRYLDVFALLQGRHLGPELWRPGRRAREVFEFDGLTTIGVEPKKALSLMPPLLRTYLTMGGWVSDHAVIDRHLNTLHVFTGLEIDRIPESRKRLLRAVAAPA